MSWIYQNKIFYIEDIEPDVIGFVYLIEHIDSQKKYVGKKNFFTKKVYQVKKKKKKKKVESDWKDYFGSNAELQHDVEVKGKDQFKRTILHLCKSKGEMSYLEIKEQIEREVLFKEEYYNSYIGCRIHRNHVKQK